MQFSTLLGKKLKDDEVIEILEDFDIDVVYSFDRFHENSEDVYWASATEDGFELRFNENQTLDVIFLFMIDKNKSKSINRNYVDVPIFESFINAKNYFEENNIQYNMSPSNNPDDEYYQRWIKAHKDKHTEHYEFIDNTLNMITLSLQKL